MYFVKEKVLFCLDLVQTIALCIYFYKAFMDWPSNGMTHSNMITIGKMFWASKTVLNKKRFLPFGDWVEKHMILVLLVIDAQILLSLVFVYMTAVLIFYSLI